MYNVSTTSSFFLFSLALVSMIAVQGELFNFYALIMIILYFNTFVVLLFSKNQKHSNLLRSFSIPEFVVVATMICYVLFESLLITCSALMTQNPFSHSVSRGEGAVRKK